MEKENPEYLLGIDIGTGSCKAVAVSVSGDVLFQTKQFYSSNSPKPGYAEQNPEDIWNAFQQCFHALTKKLAPPAAISLSSAMHSLMAVSATNEPLSPLIIWADKRAKDIAEELRSKETGKEIYSATGTPIHSMTPLCKLMWFKKNQPQLQKKTAKWIGIKEYIWFKLFGEFEIDQSIASATGLFNIHCKKWNEASLHLAGVVPSDLSRVVKTGHFREDMNKKIALQLKINVNTPVCIGASDGCLANLGSNAVKRGNAALTIGTSAAVRLAHPKPVCDYKSMMFSYILDENTFICGGPANNGGVIIPWLFRTFLNIENPTAEDYEQLFRRIDKIPAGSEGLVFVPYLLGERAPVWDEDASGMFFGIKYQHTTDHFLRAAVEGVCLTLNEIIESLESLSEKIRELNISGGFVKSKIWTQILADVTQKKLRLYEIHDASCLGAVQLAMRDLPQFKEHQPDKEKAFTEIVPHATNANAYKTAMKVFKSIYKTT